MKKFLAALAIAAIFSLAIVGALAIVPHTHGSDLNHSKHSTCPVYQFGLHGFQAAFSVFYLVFVLGAAAFFLPHDFDTGFGFSGYFSLLRAPPTR